MRVPRLAIVGRPNVGKSSLFNALAKRRVAIVDDRPGVTRDRVAASIVIPPQYQTQDPLAVVAVDTGGYGIDDTQDLTAEVEQQIQRGLAEADMLLFVIDAQHGLAPLDQTVAQLLREAGGRPFEDGPAGSGKGKPVLVVANKVDSENWEGEAFEAMQLGFGEPVGVSAKDPAQPDPPAPDDPRGLVRPPATR